METESFRSLLPSSAVVLPPSAVGADLELRASDLLLRPQAHLAVVTLDLVLEVGVLRTAVGAEPRGPRLYEVDPLGP